MWYSDFIPDFLADSATICNFATSNIITGNNEYRLEQLKDYREVENLTREAFWNVYRPGYTEPHP
jgi:hypothetical protein